jgi:anaerobic magnesium-protoporphyrin IX monomethyl ester cyclase
VYRIQLISPPLIAYDKDIFGMIPSPPIGLASVAAFLREKGMPVDLIDAFGANPFQSKKYRDQFVIIGLDIEDILTRIDKNIDVIGISVHSAMVAKFCLDLGLAIKKKIRKPVVVGGPHITLNYSQFTEAGIDFAIIGEGEQTFFQLLRTLQEGGDGKNIAGVAINMRGPLQDGKVLQMDDLPIPAWDLIPLENYWRTRINHSPFKGKFLPMITSRGCPFKCAFCTTPLTSKGKWRSYSPQRVVNEIQLLHEKYQAEDIMIQDDNFSANPNRAKKICELIIEKGLNVRLSLPSGVRLETLTPELLGIMQQAGVGYLSLSPESGSKKIRKLMNKPLNEKKLYKIQKHCKALKIKTGICFIIGSPGENFQDILKTTKMMAKMILYGADDISIFIFSPLPGAPMAKKFENNFPKDYLGLCWSPKWRDDYSKWATVRNLLYIQYAILKVLFQPLSIWRHIKNILNREFETKGEMGIGRLIANSFSGNKKSWPVRPD